MNKNIKGIGEEVFYGCENIENLIIPASVTKLGKDAFTGMSSLKKLILEDGAQDLVFDSELRTIYTSPGIPEYRAKCLVTLESSPLEEVYIGRTCSSG